jgi:hypothetical protein
MHRTVISITKPARLQSSQGSAPVLFGVPGTALVFLLKTVVTDIGECSLRARVVVISPLKVYVDSMPL